MLVLWSATVYAQRASGPVPVDDPFAKRGWHLELGGHGALEAWNYNISHEEMVAVVPGLTYGLLAGLQLTASWPLYFVSQRGVDAYFMGATFGVRGRIYRRERWATFLELKVGVSEADTPVPHAAPGSTTWRTAARASPCVFAAACTAWPASNGCTSRMAATRDATGIPT